MYVKSTEWRLTFGMRGASVGGDSEEFRRPGDGVEVPEAVSE